jgi:hypothetical protein
MSSLRFGQLIKLQYKNTDNNKMTYKYFEMTPAATSNNFPQTCTSSLVINPLNNSVTVSLRFPKDDGLIPCLLWLLPSFSNRLTISSPSAILKTMASRAVITLLQCAWNFFDFRSSSFGTSLNGKCFFSSGNLSKYRRRSATPLPVRSFLTGTHDDWTRNLSLDVSVVTGSGSSVLDM